MGIGASLFFIALGAILAFAVSIEAEGFSINTIGWILMIVGGLGLLLSIFFWSTWGGFGSRRRESVIEERERL
jgi:hypothetical protein